MKVYRGAEVVDHKQIATDTWKLRIRAPEIACSMLPGQFVMVRLSDSIDPLIGRALAIYDRWTDASGDWEGIDVVYIIKGKFSRAVSKSRARQPLDVWGPLGNAFCRDRIDHLIMVAGGVGQTPMLALASEALGNSSFGRGRGFASRVTFCYGARSADRLAGLDDFQRLGIDLRLATEDGTLPNSSAIGKPQRVTDILAEVLESNDQNESRRIACCGPEPMMEAVSKLAMEHGVTCEVSLETPMACGIGICFTCVARIRDEQGEWDYKRTCVEGPIFESESILW